MPDKISNYPVKVTIHDEDLMDFSNWNGAAFDVSEKVTVAQFKGYLNGVIANLYNVDGTLLANRTVFSVGFFTRFFGGDIICEMSDESTPYAFILKNVSGIEKGRYGYNHVDLSGEIELRGLSGLFFKVINDTMAVNTNKLFVNSTGVGAGTITPNSILHSFGDFTLGDTATSEIVLDNSASGKQLVVKPKSGAFNTFTMKLGATAGITAFETSGGAWSMNQNLRLDTPARASFYCNNSNQGMGLNGGNTVAGHIKIESDGEVIINDSGLSTANVRMESDINANLVVLNASTNNVGIGTATPNVAAIMEWSSTTMGVRQAPMTATQASAITPVEGLSVFVSDTNGTFGSIGYWDYENGAWKKR